MNLLSLLHWCRQPAPRRAAQFHDASAEELVAASEASPDDVRPRACGWFDSSHDLQHGLCVREHASADTLGRELPLASWLDLQLNGWRPTTAIAPRP